MIFAFFLDLSVLSFVKFLIYTVFIDCLLLGAGIATAMWLVVNRFLIKPNVRGEDVEWGFAFDVHLNAYFPALIILHVVQFFFYHVLISQDWYSATFVGNTLWLVAVGYYVYINFLGYSCKLQFFFSTGIYNCNNLQFCYDESSADSSQDAWTALPVLVALCHLHCQSMCQLERDQDAHKFLQRSSPCDMMSLTAKFKFPPNLSIVFATFLI